MTEYRKLVSAALEAREKAYAPYSGYRVGAALLCADGTVVRGCNIENATYTPTVCAERTAFFKAVSEGKRSFSAIAIVGGSGERQGDFAYPCGVCRQVMREFCTDGFEIVLMNARGEIRILRLPELLPFAFDKSHLAD